MHKPIVSTNLEPDRYEQMQEALKTVSSLGSQIHQYNRDIEGLKDRRDQLRVRYQTARVNFYTAIGKGIPNA